MVVYLSIRKTTKKLAKMKNLEDLRKAEIKNRSKFPYAPLVTKKDGTLTKRAKEAIIYVLKNKMHCQYYTGSGRYIRLVSYFDEVKAVLNLLGYNADFANDAPLKGKNGIYFKVSKQAKATLENLVS